MDNFKNKKPIELTEEETYELVSQIAKIEYSRNNSAKLYQDVEDGVNEFFAYGLEKDARGKKGLNTHYKKLSMSHFKNLVHLEMRNSLAYKFRKNGVQKLILECDSLDKKAWEAPDNYTTIGDNIPDEKYINRVNDNLELNNILLKVDDTNREDIYIKVQYGESEEIQPFNYRNLTKLYYDYSNNKMLSCSDFRGLLFNKSDNTELDDKKIKQIIKEYKTYILNNNILGGEAI